MSVSCEPCHVQLLVAVRFLALADDLCAGPDGVDTRAACRPGVSAIFQGNQIQEDGVDRAVTNLDTKAASRLKQLTAATEPPHMS